MKRNTQFWGKINTQNWSVHLIMVVSLSVWASVVSVYSSCFLSLEFKAQAWVGADGDTSSPLFSLQFSDCWEMTTTAPTLSKKDFNPIHPWGINFHDLKRVYLYTLWIVSSIQHLKRNWQSIHSSWFWGHKMNSWVCDNNLLFWSINNNIKSLWMDFMWSY